MKIGEGDKTVEYFIDKLNAKEQLHLVRRIAPLLVSFLPSGNPNTPDDIDPRQVASSIANVLSDLPDEKVDYIIGKCLGACRRKDPQTGMMTRLTTPSGEMMIDLPLVDQLQLVAEVVRENLADFFTLLPKIVGSIAPASQQN